MKRNNKENKLKIKRMILESIKPTWQHFNCLLVLFLITFIVFGVSIGPRVWPPNNFLLHILVPLLYLFVSFSWINPNFNLYLIAIIIGTLVYWYLFFSLIKLVINRWKSIRS